MGLARPPAALCLVRDEPAFRRDAFVGGLKRLGYRIILVPPRQPERQDLLVVWNRHRAADDIARKYEGFGAKVLVTENGYIGRDRNGVQLYALARSQHNGAGQWAAGREGRWPALGVEVHPWRRTGQHILVLPQRGIGPAGVAMPRRWTDDVVARLRKVTKRPLRVRLHPGKFKTPLEPHFADVWAAVTWGSSAALKALLHGIPVFHEFERWICAPAAKFGLGEVEAPWMGDRLPMLERLAWAQFTVAELASGEPFKRLLG